MSKTPSATVIRLAPLMRSSAGRLSSVPAYFLLRIASAMLLLKLSASFLPVSVFAIFSQFMQFAALLNLVAVGGTQNGLIRQAAAADDMQTLARRQTAALLIWAVSAALLGALILLFSHRISDLLVGAPGDWPVVIAIALLALAGGPGQVWCSVLSGRGRVAQSLVAQALGLLTSTGVAVWLITHGQVIATVIGFAGGSLVTSVAAFLFVGRLRIPLASLREGIIEVRPLLRYSLALAATASFSSIVLFGLRSHYREAFGPIELGYWICANRISDMSTQLLGLFMIQVFVPHFVTLESEVGRRRFIIGCWAVGAVVMGGAAAVFWLAPRPLVHVFLSDAFLPAIPVIQVYMIGDFLRVWVSLAMNTAFARGKPGRYAAIEMGTLAMMAVLVLGLLSAGRVEAPPWGYAGAYGIAALIASLAFAWKTLRSRQAAG